MRTRRGMTLVELMIVIAVMAILIGAALPLMRTSLEDRKVREASRQVNTLFSLAKAKAAETQLPVGVKIEERVLTIMQTPPPYAGDVVAAPCLLLDQLQYVPGTGWAGGMSDGFAETAQFSVGNCGSLNGLVKVGDFIRFDAKGPYYRITGKRINTGTPTGSLYPLPVVPSPVPADTPVGTVQLSFFLSDPTSPWTQPGAVPIASAANSFQTTKFQIYRQPVKSSLRPLELPGNAIIDFANSGFGLTGHVSNPANLNYLTTGAMIIFSPTGEVAGLTDTSGGRRIAPDVIHLLMGKAENSAVNSEFGPLALSASNATSVTFSKNLSDTSNLWISINPQTGQVNTAANSWLLTPSGSPYFENSLAAAREFAQRQLVAGGR